MWVPLDAKRARVYNYDFSLIFKLHENSYHKKAKDI